MSEATHLSDALGSFFSNAENGAFADFASATAGLSAAQAAAVPAERMNSIWAVVNHVWFWNEVPLRELRGETVAPEDLGAPNWNGWVPIGDPADEAAWQADRERVLATNAAFTAAVQALSPEQLVADLAGHGLVHHIVQVMVAHNAYHLAWRDRHPAPHPGLVGGSQARLSARTTSQSTDAPVAGPFQGVSHIHCSLSC